MPELTPKLGIQKPLGNETVSRASFNTNWDIIDVNAQKNIVQSSTQPQNPVNGDLWIDTSTIPFGFKRYNQSTATWEKIGAVTPEDIGAASQTALNTHLADFAQVWNNRIVEMGTNANGTYVRWENGLQICYGAVSITTTDDLDYRQIIVWTYPASFLQKPNVVIQPRDVVGGGVVEMRYSLQNSYNFTNEISATYWLYDSERQFTSGQNLGPFQTMAIGRWK